MGWDWFEALTARFPLPHASDHSSLGARSGMTRVTLGKSRVRESRMPGSVRAKAEWLSYSTIPCGAGAKVRHLPKFANGINGEATLRRLDALSF